MDDRPLLAADLPVHPERAQQPAHGVRDVDQVGRGLEVEVNLCVEHGAPFCHSQGDFSASAALQAASGWFFHPFPRAMPWAKSERPLRASNRLRAGNVIQCWSYQI